MPFYLQLLHLVIYNLKHDMRGRQWKVGGGRGGRLHQTSDGSLKAVRGIAAELAPYNACIHSTREIFLERVSPWLHGILTKETMKLSDYFTTTVMPGN